MAKDLPKPREEFVRMAEKDLGETALHTMMRLRYQKSLKASVSNLIKILQGLGSEDLEALSTNLIKASGPDNDSSMAYQLVRDPSSETLTVVTAETENGMIIDGEKLTFNDSGIGPDRRVKVGLSGLIDQVSVDELTPLEEISIPELAALSVYTERFDNSIEAAIEEGSVEIEPKKLF